MQAWTKDARQAEKAEQQAKAWDLWLDCLSEHDVADAIDVPRTTVQSWLDEQRKSADFVRAPESRQHFDVWNFAPARDDSAGSTSYFGVMPPHLRSERPRYRPRR